ncbi:hypothetical protein M404DRAFT_10604 [Pisolithus tinctorius Marx 270]|uniref:Uncharacterized protein n=1 Tax=Pisolithus tinctorius Marx 270 TaxID=870435 RepID=A0A0C3IMI1_PISTI|nr:hypothetical protein M404DRAFT_10604 [Pisolithus tinctorius Marx 270]
MADEQKELATNVADHGLTGQLPSSNETTEGLGVTQDCSCYITLHNGTNHELVLVYAQEKHGEWKTRPAETVSQKSNIKFWLKDLFRSFSNWHLHAKLLTFIIPVGPGAEGMVKYRIGSTEHKVQMNFSCPMSSPNSASWSQGEHEIPGIWLPCPEYNKSDALHAVFEWFSTKSKAAQKQFPLARLPGIVIELLLTIKYLAKLA